MLCIQNFCFIPDDGRDVADDLLQCQEVGALGHNTDEVRAIGVIDYTAIMQLVDQGSPRAIDDCAFAELVCHSGACWYAGNQALGEISFTQEFESLVGKVV